MAYDEKYNLNDGDKFFLFSEFPYDYKVFPLPILKGIDLTWRPSEHELYQIDNEDRLYPYRYILPMINCGINPPNACIRISSNIRNQDELFFQTILALRLVKHLRIGFSGSFIHTKNKPCDSLHLHWLSTKINVGDHNETYTAEDFKVAVEILKKIRKFKNKPKLYSRISLAIDSFSQIAVSGATSYSMVYQELFSCLGILFGSEHNAEKLVK